MKLVYACLLAVLFIGCAKQADDAQYVYDLSDVLSVEDSTEIDSTLRALNKGNIRLGVYIVDHVPPSFKGVEDAARKTGNKLGWGVSQGKIGAIIYIVVKDRRLYVAFDEGLFLTDQQARIVADSIIPNFKTLDYKNGILAGVSQVEKLVKK